jgi:predicted DNA-binding transcriptional regulator AlpA
LSEPLGADSVVDKPRDLQSDQVVSPELAAQILGVSRATLQRLWASGRGPRRLRISQRRIGVRLRDIAAYLDRCGGSAA